MHVQVGIGHLDALLVKYRLDPLVDLIVNVPVFRGFYPEPQDVLNGIVPIAFHRREGRMEKQSATKKMFPSN